ncbi:MAG: FAD-dependent oxidoreductase, partial [Micromonosporaceae bacterium]
MRAVVIGSGIAGVRVAEELHRRGCSVSVLGAERRRPYNRILLSSVLAGAARETDVVLPEPAGVEVRRGVAAVSIDRRRRLVTAADGSTTPYDALVLATGSRPWLPQIPGLTSEDGDLVHGATTFRTMADCRRIMTSPAHRAVVLGGGLLGVEAACGLAARG